MRALVVGLGRMGAYHASILSDLGMHVTTVDPDPLRSATFRALAGRVSGPPESADFDIACVAVPIPHLLRTAAEIAVRFRVSHMLVEKPFALDTAEVARFAPVLSRVPNVMVGYVERFNPVVRRLITELQGERLECIEFTRLNDRPTANARLDLWSHDVDLALHIASSGVEFDGVRYVVDGDRPKTVRRIRADYASGDSVTYDLMDHQDNPLRLQWEAFLSGDQCLPRPASVKDAVAVLRTVESAVRSEVTA